MTIVLDLPPWAVERLKAEAEAKGLDEAGLLASLLRERHAITHAQRGYPAETPLTDAEFEDVAEMTEAERRERARQIAEEARRTRPTEPPAWLAHIQPKSPPTDGTNGMHRIYGAMPTPETDAEMTALLEYL